LELVDFVNRLLSRLEENKLCSVVGSVTEKDWSMLMKRKM
jgi:hypothetical protein